MSDLETLPLPCIASARTSASTEQATNGSTIHYAITIFLSAFLLFAVQLLLGKYFLPWFGGTPAMWTTCMLFFQLLLLAGYVYAHVVATRLSPRIQAQLHFALLAASSILIILLTLRWHAPLLPDSSWRPGNGGSPIWSITLLLGVSAGLPYFVLSSTGPLLQSWFAGAHPHRRPYRLYALSNLGSLLALLSYPFVVEPHLSLRTQARVWSVFFFAYAIVCGICAKWYARLGTLKNARSRQAIRSNRSGCEGTTPGLGEKIFWVALAACASVMFLATTSQICQDVAVVPLLWVLPLCIYLLSFVICFDKANWYTRGLFHPALVLAVFLACFVLNGGALKSLVSQLVIYAFTLFVCCMVCHGELARSKPDARHLTSFYLMVALGGAMGGIFVVLIAPHTFRAYWEYHLGVWATVLLFFVALMRDKQSWLYCRRFGLATVALGTALLPGMVAWATSGTTTIGYWVPAAAVLLAVGILVQHSREGFDPTRARAVPWYCTTALVVLGALLFVAAKLAIHNSVSVARGFYGVLSVQELGADQPAMHGFSLTHGRVAHGFQFRQAEKRSIPTMYYGESSGVGRAIRMLQSRAPRPHSIRIGVAGLGVGTLAAFGRTGDYIRFYEINPEVIRMANDQHYFTYLHDCPATVNIIAGDARLSMESELARGEKQNFDLLIIDAFSGDAPPTHLLTKEGFQVYLDQIKDPGGVVAVHITNTYLDFRPVIASLAAHFHLSHVLLHSNGDGATTGYNDWIVLSRDRALIDSLTKETAAAPPSQQYVQLWTDDYSNLFEVLRTRH